MNLTVLSNVFISRKNGVLLSLDVRTYVHERVSFYEFKILLCGFLLTFDIRVNLK